MQRACTVFSSVVSPGLLHFSTLSHKRYGFRKEVIEHKMCGLRYQNSPLFHWYAINSLKCRVFLTKDLVFPANGLIKNVALPSSKVPRYCCPILIKLEFFCTDFRKILKYQVS